MPKRKGKNPESSSKTTKRADSNKRLNGSIFTRIKFRSWRDINETLGKQRCKAVIIENCPTLQEVAQDTSFIELLAKWEVFIVVLFLSELVSTNAERVLKISKVIKNPLLLQLNYEDGKIIFYKEENVKFKRLVLLEDKIEESSIMNGINFAFFCNLLRNEKNIGIFNFNLPETEVAMEKSICGYRLIDWAVKHNNILCLMFLKLFDPDFESLNGSSTRLLEVAAEFGTVKSFEILLNKKLYKTQKQKLYHSSKNNESLLSIAVKNGNLDIVSFLIECGLNANLSNRTGETMSEVAWKNYTKSAAESDTKSNNKNLDILIKLLYNDAPFPRNFDKSQIKSKFDLLRIEMLIRKKFNDAILNGQLGQVKRFTENKLAYDVNNKCALKTAIESKNFEIYSFLRSKGFSGLVDRNLDFHLQSLDDNDKDEIRKCNLKYFKTNESQHIMDLVTKSRLAFGSDQRVFGEIQKLFEILDAFEEIRPILKIVASSDQTDIVFDFNNSLVEEMDPTGSRFAYGRTYDTGNILIGAWRENENILLGTLAHELTHYAMQLIYDNKSLPFKFDDESSEKEFKAIVETYDNPFYKSRNEIIAGAFNKKHDLEQRMAELIVRVPHLIAMHRNEPEVLAVIREEFSLLFDFFEQQTLPDLKKEADLTKLKRDIRKTNAKLGVYYKGIQSNWLSDAFFPSIDISKNIFVETSVPDLALESFVRTLLFAENEIDSRNIFVNLEQMFNKENFEMLKSAAEPRALQKIFIFEDSDKPNSKIDEDELGNLFNQCVIVFISNNKKSAFHKCFSSKNNFSLDWSNLSDESKSKIMKSKVTFQDQEVTLREIVDNELFLDYVPLELLLEPSKLKLKSFSEILPEPPRVFIERTFINSVQWEKIKTKDICEILKNQKKVLIADSAGMGKSTSAAQLARKLKLQNPLSWVVFIDLKAHTNAFVRDDQPRTGTIDDKYFSQKLLKLGETFEQKLFESFFEKRKVIFVIDGFDEISPNYKQFVMEILKTIQNSENQLLVTTRPHLVEDLKKELNASVFKLMPFSKEEQIEFLTKYWQHTKNIDEAKVKSWLENFNSKQYDPNEFYSTPIHIFMLAEVFDDQDLIDLDDIKMDTFSLYKRFITIKLKVWVSKGPLAEEENVEIQQSTLNLQQIFHNLALKQVFDAEQLEELNWSEIPEEIINEMVLRVGIVSFGSDGTFQFTHRTFAEYFIADFILKGVSGKNPQKANLNLFFKSLDKTKFVQVRTFMDEGLRYFEDKLNAKALSRHFVKFKVKKHRKILFIQLNKGKHTILDNAVSENCANLVAFVLEKLILDTNVKIKLVKKILLEAVKDIETFKVICRSIENFEENVQREILFYRGVNNPFAETGLLPSIIQAEEIDRKSSDKIALRLILEVARSSLNEEEFLKFILGEEDAFEFYEHALWNQGVLKEIWEAATCKLGNENLKKLATGRSKEGNTILLSFDEIFSKRDFDCIIGELLWWLEDIKNLLTTNELSKLIAAKNSIGHTLFTKIVEFIKFEDFQKLWKFIKENVDEAGQRKLIFHKDQFGMNSLVLSIENKDKRVSDLVYEITESMLLKDGKDIIGYFKEQGRLVDLIFVAIWLDLQFEKISAKLEKDELRTILLSKNAKGKNILHSLVQHRNNNDNPKPWNLVIDIINDVQAVKNLLFEIDWWLNKNKNVFHLAASSGADILIHILNWCKVHFSHEDFKNIFLERNVRKSFTLLHEWSQFESEDFDEKGFAFVEENFSSEDRDMIFSLRDDRSRTPHMIREER